MVCIFVGKGIDTADMIRENSVLSTSTSSSDLRELEEVEASDVRGVRWVLRYLVGSSINLVLPFLNGLMLGFGELVAHELCWQYKWFYHGRDSAHKIFPVSRKLQASAQTQQQAQDQEHISKAQHGYARLRERWTSMKSKFL